VNAFGINSSGSKLLFTRGGSTVEELEGEDPSYDDNVMEVDSTMVTESAEDDAARDDNPPSNNNIATGSVHLLFLTNWGNSVIDHKIELSSKRTKTVADLKKSLSKQLPGKPPILVLELVFEGRILDDETLVEELFEDEDDEDYDNDIDDDDSEGPSRKLTLNIVPPVDPKFMTELGPKLKFHSDDAGDDYDSIGNRNNYAVDYSTNIESLSTTDLVDAYYLNQVAMGLNSNLISNPNTRSSPFTRLESIDEARRLREDLCTQVGTDKWKELVEINDDDDTDTNIIKKSGDKRRNKEEWRGERYRNGKGGVTNQFKTTLQTNLNVNWGDAIKNFMLLLFLGYFGGKNSFSRHLLLWGAPLSFLLQARPLKMWLKAIFYMFSNPPAILLTFLPAPQQAILSVNFKSSCVALYGEDGTRLIFNQLGLNEDDNHNENKSTTTAVAIAKTKSTLHQEDKYSYDDEYDTDEENESDDQYYEDE